MRTIGIRASQLFVKPRASFGPFPPLGQGGPDVSSARWC
jgi:hypothetical protein